MSTLIKQYISIYRPLLNSLRSLFLGKAFLVKRNKRVIAVGFNSTPKWAGA